MASDSKPEALQFLTVKETAAYLHHCEKQVRRLITKGDLMAYRFGTALRINQDDIDTYVAERRLNKVLCNS